MKKIFLPTSIKAFLLTVAVLFFNTTLTYGQNYFKVEKDGSINNYSTFTEALVYINQYGDKNTTLTLLDNYTVDNNVEFDLIIQKPITFNLNGYVLHLNNGTLYTEVDNSVTITNKDDGSLFNIGHSDGGTIRSNNAGVLIPYGPLTLKNVTVETTLDLPNYQQGCNVKFYVIENSDNLILEEGTKIKGCCDDSQTNVEFPTTRYIKPVKSVDKLKLGHACDLFKIEGNRVINVCDGFGYNFDDLGSLYQVMKAQNFKAEYNGRSQTFGCLEDAIDANNYPAAVSDVTITLLKDFIRKEDYFNTDRYKDDYQTVNEIISKINFTLDFTNFSITDTFAITVKNGKKLTIKAGENDNFYAFINLEGGAELNLKGGNWNFYTEFLKINSGCTATIEPNSVTTGVKSSSDWSINTHSPKYIPFVENNGGTLTIDDGTFDYSNVEGSDATILYGIYAKSGGTTIKDGIFGQQNKPGYAMKIDDGSKVTISGGEFYGKNGSGSNPAIDYKGENALLDQTKKLMFCGDGNSPIIFTDDNDDCVLEKWKKKASEWTLQDDPVLIVTEYRNEDKTINDYILSQILLEREYDGGIYVNSKSNEKMYTGGSPLGLAVSLQAIAYQDPKNSNDEDAASDVGNNKNIVATPDAWAFWYKEKLYLWSAKTVKISNQGSITPRVVNPKLTDETFKVRKEYDGTTDIPVELLKDVDFTFPEEDELAINEDVQLVFTGASFVTRDVDVAKEVAYSFKLDGENARHFKLPEDNNSMILTNGTITPRPLTDEEKSAIESKIKDCVVRQKYEDGKSECKLKANSFVYEISDILKVTVTIEEAQYINQEGRPISEIGGPYDIVVTYHVDDNFIFGGENDDMTTQSHFLISGEGAILERPKAEIPTETVSPMDDEVKFCAEGDGSVALKFNVVNGVAEYYKLTFEKSDVLKEQNGKVSQGNDGEYVDIVVPSGVVPGEYTGYLVFADETGDVVSERYQFVLNLNMARDVVKYLYKNVIFVDNKDSLFTAYQWYKNGEPIPSSNKFHNRQYYTEEYKDLDGVYYVDITTNAGIKLKTCPLAGKGLVGKRSIASVKVYPNPAKANVPFTLQLVDENGFDESFYAGAEILIYTNNGTLVKRISQVGKTISVTLPSGYYSGALINGGSKSGFKIVVE